MVLATGAVTAQSGGTPFWQKPPPPPQYGTVPYKNVDPAREPAAPNLPQTDPDALRQQMMWMMSLAGLGGGGGQQGLNYALYSPEEMARRGLAMSGANRGALNSTSGYIGRQAQNNTLQNQLAGQDIGAQRDANMLNAEQMKHQAQGQFAANGAISSDASRQALGGSDHPWKDYSRTPWNPDARGDIMRNRDLTNQGLYRQLMGQMGNYDTTQAGLYNQLQQLMPQYLQLDQGDDAYNRLLNGQVNKNVTPEQRALMAALGQAI